MFMKISKEEDNPNLSNGMLTTENECSIGGHQDIKRISFKMCKVLEIDIY